ncbi:MAG: terpene cyclase/mutase family protein [Planctomycetes bacterium]|nr:terpene cyclase/mutase family protein [Planctomycetota bacterium]
MNSRRAPMIWPPPPPELTPIPTPPDPGPLDDELEAGSWDNSFFQDRFGGRRNAVARGGGTQGPGGTEGAVCAGLRWLTRHQADDGSWTGREFNGCLGCAGLDPDADPVETTALGLLAFLGAGYTHVARETYVDAVSGKTVSWGETIRNALRWLLKHQDPDGGFSSPSGSRNLRAEAIAALALGEAYGTTNSLLFHSAAARCIAALTSASRSEGGWGTSVHAATGDMATTAWALCALRVGRANGFTIEKAAVGRAHQWLDLEMKSADRSAEALFAHILTDSEWCTDSIVHTLRIAKTDAPSAPDPMEPELWHWTTLALFHATAPDRPEWRDWNERLTSRMVRAQVRNAEDCPAGSWAAPEDYPGGRLRATALNILTLETYYRYPRRLCAPALR